MRGSPELKKVLAAKWERDGLSDEHRSLVLASCKEARKALPCVPKECREPLAAIELAEAWAKQARPVRSGEMRLAKNAAYRKGSTYTPPTECSPDAASWAAGEVAYMAEVFAEYDEGTSGFLSPWGACNMAAYGAELVAKYVVIALGVDQCLGVEVVRGAVANACDKEVSRQRMASLT